MKIVNITKTWLDYIVLNTIAGSYICPRFLRKRLYALYGHYVSRVYPDCFIGVGPGHLRVGKGSFCNYRCFFDLGADITIGANCAIGFGVTFVNSYHLIGPSNHRAGTGKSLPITIEDGCWIGANSTIMPGVIIAKGCVIGAGALVNKSTLPNGLYLGVPAKRIKDIS